MRKERDKVGERERERENDRETERGTHRQTETERKSEKDVLWARWFVIIKVSQSRLHSMGEARLVKRHNDSFVKPTDELAGRGKAGGGLFLEQGSTMSAGTVQV